VAYRRWPWERIIAAVASAIAIIQAPLILQEGAAHLPPLRSLLANTAPAFLGRFLVGNWVERPAALWLAALGVALGIAVGARALRRESVFWICLYLLVGTVGLSVLRVDPALMHPRFGGPRYFFFPFILTSWLLVQSAYAVRHAWKRALAAGMAFGAVVNAFPAWSRQHDDLQWTRHALSCREFPAYEIPVQYDGHRESAWKLRMSGAACRRLLDRDLLLSKRELESRPTFPYAVFSPAASGAPAGGSLVRTTMAGADFSRSVIPGFKVVGSYHVSDADVGEVEVKLQRGESLRYRSGPTGRGQRIVVVGHEKDFIQELPLANEWVKLVFSNAALPAEFTVRISDEGRDWGEWSAIAIPDPGPGE
jgi:hypothetical protein